MNDSERLIMAICRLAKNDMSAVPTADRRDILGIVAGILVGTKLTLPTTPIEELVNYYVSTHEGVAAKLFSQVNEREFINTSKALETTRNIYLFRYKLLHDEKTILKLLPIMQQNDVTPLPPALVKQIEGAGFDLVSNAIDYYF